MEDSYYFILLYSDIEEIIKCNILSKNNFKCLDVRFWLNKFNYDNLPTNHFNYDNFNVKEWVITYKKTLVAYEKAVRSINYNETIIPSCVKIYINDINDINIILQIIDQCNLKLYTLKDIISISLYFINLKYAILIIETYKNTYKYKITKKESLHIITIQYYFNLFKKLIM